MAQTETQGEIRMIKSRILKAALAIVTIGSAISLFSLGSIPAQASALPSYKLIVNSGFTALNITANGAGNLATISNSGKDDNWVFVNSQKWTAPNGLVYTVSEMQHAGTTECISDKGGAFYVEGCSAGNPDELLLQDPTGSTTNGSPNEWYYSVAASDAAHAFRYLTAASLTNGAILVTDPAGEGGLAAWNKVCTANC
jgi:hypothetical protein